MTTFAQSQLANRNSQIRKPNPRRDHLIELSAMIRRTEDFLNALRLRKDELLAQSDAGGYDAALDLAMAEARDEWRCGCGELNHTSNSVCRICNRANPRLRAPVTQSPPHPVTPSSPAPDPDAQVEHPERFPFEAQ